jgi:hypothetical protein
MTARKTALRLVAGKPPGPDLTALQGFVEEAMRSTVPALTRESVAIENFATGLRVTEAELTALREQRSLVERLFGALITSFDAAEADLDKTISRYRNGLADGAEGQ